ncbi:PIN domain-containing protein [Thermovenabulum gondwanense]|uniref:PIN domain-containing protein n=1 Tax=Thermovenabulum gondwanense TaxID=520767 RepID=A0A161PWZ9_9FIRM|nr:PIN domain-containing protein [Thermovenabulum gondwanense]KYO66123.1 hypothetical protein ATZ99_13150 [Thermovenabulum gondwanense]
MNIVDANIILRYLLEDIPELAEKAAEILENNEIFIPNEVFAEVVYVLEKVYKINRKEIKNILCEFLSYKQIEVIDKELLMEAFKIYYEVKIDFIDAILYSYKKCKNYNVLTFDRKLMKIIQKL